MARRVVSKEEFVTYLRAHGPTETAKWEDEIRAAGGYVEPLLPPDGGELPAVDGPEEGASDGALPAVGAPVEDEDVGGLSVTPTSYMQQGRDLQRDFEVAQRQLAKRREAQYMAQQRMAEQQFAGPSRTEQLLALSNAFFQPPQYRGFAGTMANVLPALQQITQARRTAEQQRAEALMRLQQQYQTSQAEDRAATLANRLAIYKAQAPLVKPRSGTWSDNLSQFVSPDRPVATPNKVQVGSYTLTQYTDGSLRLKNPDGSFSVYSEDGEKLGDIPAGGAK